MDFSGYPSEKRSHVVTVVTSIFSYQRNLEIFWQLLKKAIRLKNFEEY